MRVSDAHLVEVGLGLGMDGGAEGRRGKGGGREQQRPLLARERVAGGGLRQLGHGADVAGHQLGRRLLALAPHREELPDALRRVLVGVPGLRVGLEDAGADAEVGELAHVGVGAGLEDQGRQRARRVGLETLLLVGVRVLGDCFADVLGRRQVLGDGVEEQRRPIPLVADPASTGTTEPAATPARRPRVQLLLAQLLALQVLVDERVVGLRDGLHQLLAVARRLVGEGVRHVALAPLLAAEALHGQQVDHALERALRADGQLEGNALLAEHRLELAQRLEEVGVLAVHAVDEDQAGEVALVGEGPGVLGADLDAGGGADDDEGGVGGAQARLHLPHEVGVAGRVDDVELLPLPLAGEEGEVDADLALVLVGVEVGDGGAVVHAAQPADSAAAKSIASASEVLPVLPWPTRATLRMSSVL